MKAINKIRHTYVKALLRLLSVLVLVPAIFYGSSETSLAAPVLDELPRFSPRQADVLFVVGTISHKLAPVLVRIHEQMADPKWVVAFGVCTCTGGFYDNYATVMGIDTIMPVDVYIPGCPPRPEMVLDGLMKLQDKIQDQHTTGKRSAPESRPEVFEA